MKRFAVAAVAAALALLPAIGASAAVPATPEEGYTKPGAGTSSSPWPSEQNGDVTFAASYSLDGGTLVIIRYSIGLDYQSTTSAERKAVSDLPFTNTRMKIVLVNTPPDEVIHNILTAVPETTIGIREVDSSVNRGYSEGFMAIFLGDEIYSNIRVDLISTSDDAVVKLAHAKPTFFASDDLRLLILTSARNNLTIIQSTAPWTDENITLIGSDGVLTPFGERYMKNNAPYLRHAAASLYDSTLDYPPFRFEYGDAAGAQDEVDAAIGETRFSFQRSFRGMSEWTGVPERTLSTVAVMALGVAMALFVMRIAGSALVVVPVFIMTLAFGAMMSWVPMTLIAIIGACAAIAITFLLFVKRA